jgi:hypothetical protein
MGENTLLEIAKYHSDVESSLRLYFSPISPAFNVRFFGQRPSEIAGELMINLEETDQRSAFFVLAWVEAAFRVDYDWRCQKKMKDDLSRIFRGINKNKKTNVRLDEDIFEAWIENSAGSRELIAQLRAAFRFRHWVAHGRYWLPKLGRKYDFNFVYSLADEVLAAFPFCGLG